MSTYYVIRDIDVGKKTIRAFGLPWLVSGFIGAILPQDVGKRVYRVDEYVLQVENKEQFEKRIRRENITVK